MPPLEPIPQKIQSIINNPEKYQKSTNTYTASNQKMKIILSDLNMKKTNQTILKMN